MEDNKPKYVIINGDEIVGTIYFSEKYGRTIVFTRGINIEEPVRIYDNSLFENVVDVDFLSFIQSMIPTD
jgi:hypothetical protein